MFELESMTKVKVLDVRVLSQKDRGADDPPGGQLLLQVTLPSSSLAMFDGSLPIALYRNAKTTSDGQVRLDGMEGDELTSIGSHVKRLGWVYEQTGCNVEIDHGTGGKSNISLTDCKVHRVSISPKEGGSVNIQFTLDAPALPPAVWAKLPSMKATEIQMTMHGPEVAEDIQADIEDQKPKRSSGKVKKGPWPFGEKGDKNAPNVPEKTPEQALAESMGGNAS